MNTGSSLLLTVLVIIGAFAGTGYLYSENGNLKNELIDVRQENQQLQSQVAEYQQAMGAMNDQINVCNNEKAELNNGIAQLEQTLQVARIAQAQADGEIVRLEQENGALAAALEEERSKARISAKSPSVTQGSVTSNTTSGDEDGYLSQLFAGNEVELVILIIIASCLLVIGMGVYCNHLLKKSQRSMRR